MDRSRILYSCNICGLCEELCPVGINIGELILDLRRDFSKGENLPPFFLLVMKNQEWMKSNFYLIRSDPENEECDRVFFPGCILSGYSPFLVTAAHRYLREKLGSTGIFLSCCGSPIRLLGKQNAFERHLNELESRIKKVGASEVITACPECYRIFKQNSSLEAKNIYKVIDELGLPQFERGENIFSLHDPCPSRHEKNLRESVRGILAKMKCQIEEMDLSQDKTRCCGSGGLVPFSNFSLFEEQLKQRADEAGFDIISYCASCIIAFVSLGKSSIHLLDLVFNPDLEKARLTQSKISDVRKNQLKIRSVYEE